MVGLALAAASGVLLVVPVALPAGIITMAGYLTIAGSVVAAASQTAVINERVENENTQGNDST